MMILHLALGKKPDSVWAEAPALIKVLTFLFFPSKADPFFPVHLILKFMMV